jgi:predicted dehydrogenase
MAEQGTPLKIAIAGCGRAAEQLHIPALQKLPEAEVVALVDSSPEALQRVGNRFGIERRCAELDNVLADPTIDIVAVCVPPALHAETALPVLAAGKHLLVEKPLALNLDDCDRMIAQASTTDAHVMVGFSLRFNRLIRAAKAFIDAGKLGTIQAIRSTWTSAIRHRQKMPGWRDRADMGGGALFEIGVHHFDLWRHLLSTEVEEVFACSRSEEFPNETVGVTARLASGAVASSFFSERTSDVNEIDIWGDAACLRLSIYRYDGFEFIPVLTTPGLATRLRVLGKKIYGIPEGLSIAREGGDFRLAFRAEWEHFLDVVRRDVPVESTLEDGRRAVAVVLAATESAHRGTPVKISHAARTITVGEQPICDGVESVD